METFKDYFGVNFEYEDDLDSKEKIKALIVASELSGGEIDTLIKAWDVGLLESGETPSKAGRSKLIEKGVLCQTCCEKTDYAFSVTYPFGFHVFNAYSFISNMKAGQRNE